MCIRDRNRRTGCENSDTIYVPQNHSPPQANIIASDTLLTCAVRNILLTGNSSNEDVIFQWTDTSATFFSDPFSDSLPGIFQLHITDTANGCTNISNLIFINSWTTPPGILPLVDSLFLNCSHDSISLNASSLYNNTTFEWNGPSN